MNEMKRFFPHLMGSLFVVLIIAAWVFAARMLHPNDKHSEVQSGPDTVYVTNAIETYEMLMNQYGRPYMFRDGIQGGTTTWEHDGRYIDLIRHNDTAYIVYR